MNRYKISTVGAMLCVLGLGFSDTASGQITTNPPLSGGMTFQVQSGGASSFQNLTITTNTDPTTLDITVPAGQSWLTVSGAPGGSVLHPNTPATVPVTVNTAGLSSGVVLSANIVIAINGRSASQVSFPVTLTVGTPTVLSANPASLTFSATQGSMSGSPNPATVTVSSSTTPLTYSVNATTQNGVNWLLLSNTSNLTTGTSTFSVYVNPSAGVGLTAGNYTGNIFVQSTTTGDTLNIPVTLQVTVGAALNVTGTPSNFVYQFGSGQGNIGSQQQTLMVSTASGTLNFCTAATSTGPTTWLVVNPNGGLATTTPQAVNLTLSPQVVQSLPVGTYVIQLTVGPTGLANCTGTTIPVTLIVSNNPLLNISSQSLAFSVPLGSGTSALQNINVTSTGAPIPYVVSSSQPWLQVSPSSGTTSTNPILAVSVNPSLAGLGASQTPYKGILTITPTNGDQYNLQVQVSLTVGSATSTIYAGPDQLLFSYQPPNTAPGPQLVQLTSGTPTSFSITTTSVTAANCTANNWLTATANQNVTPATLTVNVQTAGMTAGSCTGNVTVTYNNGATANATTVIPVAVNIAPTALLTVSPPFGFGVVTASVGSNNFIINQVVIDSTDGSAIGFSSSATTPGSPTPWLSIANPTGSTPRYSLQVQILPNGLPIGTYTGSIAITANAGANLPSGTLTIPVVLIITANATVSVAPTSLTFTQAQGATTLPAAQSITITPAGGTPTFSAQVSPVTGGNWLQVSPSSGNASGTIAATVTQNTLSPGSYTSNIVLTFQNAATTSITIPVTLNVTAAQTVAVTPTSLTFAYQLGNTAPAAQTLNVTSTGGANAVTVTSTTANGNGWLTVTPASGSTGATGTPLVLTASIVPASLTTPGTYNGSITITPTGQAAITVPVTITVTQVSAPQPATISNSASLTFGAISPGELITIKGAALGPATSATFTVTNNTVASTLAGVQVLFDGIPGTPIFVSATQINAIVPYEIAGRTTTNVVVTYQGQQSSPITQSVASQAPGIYTFSSNGSGQAAVLNQNGSYNGPASGLVIGGQAVSTVPAQAGSVIAIFMTGGGQTSPAGTTGTVTPSTLPLLNIPGTVTVTINGVNAPVQFAGAAPGEVTGVIQVNVTVPTGVTGSGLPLVVNINGVASPAGPTVSVQ